MLSIVVLMIVCHDALLEMRIIDCIGWMEYKSWDAGTDVELEDNDD